MPIANYRICFTCYTLCYIECMLLKDTVCRYDCFSRTISQSFTNKSAIMKIAKYILNSSGERFPLNFHRSLTPSSPIIWTDSSPTPIIFGQIRVHFVTGKHALDCLLFYREEDMDGQELIARKDQNMRFSCVVLIIRVGVSQFHNHLTQSTLGVEDLAPSSLALKSHCSDFLTLCLENCIGFVFI